ncbi:MAG: transketolase family protein [Opitutales bacterium]
MRNAFADEILKLAEKDERIVLLSGDIGNRLFDPFKAACPDRFFNCGVAEQNMVGMAAGLALRGYRPVVYTITSFLLNRPYEQIRIDVGYHHLPVTFVGVGGGLSYASNGGTHHATEDIALMRTIPGMQIVAPGDAPEVRAAVNLIGKVDQPLFIRIGKKKEPVVHESPVEYALGGSICFKESGTVGICVTGNLLPFALEANEILQGQGVDARLYHAYSLEPIDQGIVDTLFDECTTVFSVEEHSVQGGLGSILLETAHQRGHDTRKLKKIGTPHSFHHRTATQQQHREQLGLTAEGIAKQIRENLPTLNSKP